MFERDKFSPSGDRAMNLPKTRRVDQGDDPFLLFKCIMCENVPRLKVPSGPE
jgi:hypothetical protein